MAENGTTAAAALLLNFTFLAKAQYEKRWVLRWRWLTSGSLELQGECRGKATKSYRGKMFQIPANCPELPCLGYATQFQALQRMASHNSQTCALRAKGLLISDWSIPKY